MADLQVEIDAPSVLRRITVSVDGKPAYRDVLTFSPEDYAKETPESLEAMAKDRHANWVATVDSMLAESALAYEKDQALTQAISDGLAASLAEAATKE